MNEKLMRDIGFGHYVDLVKEGKCPICEQPVNHGNFRDDEAREEFRISGLCQSCQDDVFGISGMAADGLILGDADYFLRFYEQDPVKIKRARHG